MELKDRIKYLRKDANLKQTDLAEILNVARATVSGYETKGKEPDIDKLLILADLFNVSLDYLLTGKHSQPNVSFETFLSEKDLDSTVHNLYSELNYQDKTHILKYLSYIHSKSIY